MIEEVKQELRKYSSKEDAAILQRFFKTGPGEYGEGDIFIGVKVPPIRKTADKYSGISTPVLRKLIKSPVHEERLLSLIILTKQFKKADETGRKEIIDFYLDNRKYINNWDLVDLSAPYIIGPYFYDKDRRILYDLVKNGSMWDKRIAVLASFYFIKQKDYTTSLEFVTLLMDDKRDLINKACGWMLREIGKRDIEVEEEFLKLHYKTMPRTMLRYAIEKFPEEKRQWYLKGWKNFIQ
jgi:3-methyladenine DNA glycosylase AlkD